MGPITQSSGKTMKHYENYLKGEMKSTWTTFGHRDNVCGMNEPKYVGYHHENLMCYGAHFSLLNFLQVCQQGTGISIFIYINTYFLSED